MKVIQGAKVPIKAWVDNVDSIEDTAREQLDLMSRLPFIHHHLAVMPDVHWGMGATVGSVIAAKRAVVPAAVGVDIGCGMMAVKTSLRAEDLPDDLKGIRHQIERDIPVGFNGHREDRWELNWTLLKNPLADGPAKHAHIINELESRFAVIRRKHPGIKTKQDKRAEQLGTLGGGNHFIEVCLDEDGAVWFMLHSGSRNTGKVIADYFITKAKEECERWHVDLPHRDLAFLPQGTEIFDDYVEAVMWAQDYAASNRRLMLQLMTQAVFKALGNRDFHFQEEAVNCHHNYVSLENHFGENVVVTRKGAVRAREGDLGIIPGSMGARSYIVRGLGNPDSFHSCSHGAGRAMSRKKARETFTVEDHVAATSGIECRKDQDVIDETPGAYKDIDVVMENQRDLVEPVAVLRQVLCVKG